MKKLLFVLSIVAVCLFTSCVTGVDSLAISIDSTQSNLLFEDENIATSITIIKSKENGNVQNSSSSVTMQIKNKTNKGLSLITDYTTYMTSNGELLKLVPGETVKITATLSQPPIAIPANSTISKTFYFIDDIKVVDALLDPELQNSSIVFGYKLDNHETICNVSNEHINHIGKVDGMYQMRDGSHPAYSKYLGQVTAKKKNWNILFLSSEEARKQALYNQVLEVAKKQFGNDIIIANVRYNGSWNPLSILLYFSMLGFVENATVTADVLGK